MQISDASIITITYTIVHLFIILIINIQTGDADVVDNLETKVGVCNYRGKSDPLQDAPQDIIRRNVENYLATIRKAVESEKVKLIIFPEGGLTTLAPFHEKRDVYLKYSLNIWDWEDSCPCDDDKWSSKGAAGEAILKLSCAAKSNHVHVVVNILEKELFEENLSSYNIFNTNLVFNTTGHIIIRYRKNIPDIQPNGTNKDDNNIFTIDDRIYKTIIGNDIYKESYVLKKTKEKSISIVWSTASQKRKSTIPALILAQVYGKKGSIDIFISDYSDDEWNTSGIYYKGILYYSFGEQSDDELVIIPSDNESDHTRRKLNSNFFKQFESIKSEDQKCSSCSIVGSDTLGALPISGILSCNTTALSTTGVEHKAIRHNDIQHTGTEHNFISIYYRVYSIALNPPSRHDGDPICLQNIPTGYKEFNVSLCGIAATQTNYWQYDKLSIKWNNTDECIDQFFLPITTDAKYWPLQNSMYEYNENSPGIISLRNTTKFTIFALMCIRNTTKDCTNNDSEDNSPTQFAFIHIIVVVVVVVVAVLGGIYVFIIWKRKNKLPSQDNGSMDQEQTMMKP